MDTRHSIDTRGATILVGFSILLAFNQVVIKLTNTGVQPVFQAGLRSALAIVPLALWMLWKRIPILPQARNLWPSLLIGLFFAAEFLCLYTALDLTTVGRVSILFYTMPIWLAIAAHFLLPGETLNRMRGIGLVLAILGVAWAVFDRDPTRVASVWGDLLALGAALMWGGIALTVRMSRLSREMPETQLMAQLVVWGPILLLAGVALGDPLRDPSLVTWAGIGFQTLAIAFFGYLLWFKLVATYSASGVASFSFLSPVISVILGAVILGEAVHLEIMAALALVALGLVLINRKG